MANPRFEDDNWGSFEKPDLEKIKCKDCKWRAKDRKIGKTVIYGASLSVCKAYSVKPREILWKNEDCPYYMKEDEDE